MTASDTTNMRFLSAEHLASATDAINANREASEAAQDVTLGILYTVTGGPDGDFTYHIRIADGRVEMARGPLEGADAEVASSYDTAVGLNTGEIGNQQALLTGKIRLKGSIITLVRHTALLNLVQSIASSLDVTY